MLNETQKDRLGAVDDILLQSIRQVFTDEVEKNKPVVSGNNPNTLQDNNELLGEKYRAYVLSQAILEGAFTEIGSYKSTNTRHKVFNKGL